MENGHEKERKEEEPCTRDKESERHWNKRYLDQNPQLKSQSTIFLCSAAFRATATGSIFLEILTSFRTLCVDLFEGHFKVPYMT